MSALILIKAENAIFSLTVNVDAIKSCYMKIDDHNLASQQFSFCQDDYLIGLNYKLSFDVLIKYFNYSIYIAI